MKVIYKLFFYSLTIFAYSCTEDVNTQSISDDIKTRSSLSGVFISDFDMYGAAHNMYMDYASLLCRKTNP